MAKKMMMLLCGALCAATSLFADTQSDWYASLTDRREPSEVRVGDDVWQASNERQPLPHHFSCGAVLHSTVGGLRLDLNNVTVAKGLWHSGIDADGDLAIYLSGVNYVQGRVEARDFSSCALLIFGPGSLTIRCGDSGGSSIEGSQVSICAGANISILCEGNSYGAIAASSLLINTSSVAIYSEVDGAGVSASKSVNVLGSIFTIKSKKCCIVCGNAVVDGSVVSLMSEDDLSGSFMTFSCTHSYYSSCGRWYGDEAYFENSIAKIYCKEGVPLSLDNWSVVNNVTFGEGDYYIVSGGGRCGIESDNVAVKGGNVRVCVPGDGDEAIGIKTFKDFKIDSGRLEIVDKVDARELFKYDAAAAAALTGITAVGGVNVSARMTSFYSEVILDAISNGKINDVNGNANVGVFCFNQYIQNGGTVWCDAANCGLVVGNSAIINGGSYKGEVFGDYFGQ